MRNLTDTFKQEACVSKISDTFSFRMVCWLYGHNRDLYNKHWSASLKRAIDEHELTHPTKISNMTEEQKEKRRAECRRYRARKRQKKQESEVGKSKDEDESEDEDDDESYTIT